MMVTHYASSVRPFKMTKKEMVNESLNGDIELFALYSNKLSLVSSKTTAINNNNNIDAAVDSG